MTFRARLRSVQGTVHRLIRRNAFDNRSFWNERYEKDPEVGSGPGSRGENLLLKNRAITRAIAEDRIASVLDIGCGDIEILKDLDIPEYTGIDISEVVVARNRRIRPEWNFVCADLAGDYIPPQADAVLCLDVLIHQKRARDYAAISGKALQAAGKLALVSGYARPDPGWNVFFHESIRDTVRRLCPAATVDAIAEYRGTELLRVQMGS